jgi:CRP-like cAMP-binding protein
MRVAHESGIKNQHFEPGDTVFHEGDLGDSVYVIERGECEVIKEEAGVQHAVATLQAGNYFGEMALLSDLTRNATVRARTALDVLLIPKGDLNRLRVPAFGEVFNELARSRAIRAEPDS